MLYNSAPWSSEAWPSLRSYGARCLAEAAAAARGAPEHGPTLTPRQCAVLALIAEGLGNKEIARRLGVAPATIKTHVAQAIASIGGVNRTDAAMKAKQRGFI